MAYAADLARKNIKPEALKNRCSHFWGTGYCPGRPGELLHRGSGYPFLMKSKHHVANL